MYKSLPCVDGKKSTIISKGVNMIDFPRPDHIYQCVQTFLIFTKSYLLCIFNYTACRLVAKTQDAGGLHIANEQYKKFKATGSSASPMQNRRVRRKSGIFNTNVSI